MDFLNIIMISDIININLMFDIVLYSGFTKLRGVAQ